MSKFRSERYIKQIQSTATGKWTFRVRINNIEKAFAERNYANAMDAFSAARKYRDQVLANGTECAISHNKTVDEVFSESFDLFPVRMETRRKLTNFYNKYVEGKNRKIKTIRSEDILINLNNMIEIATDDTINRVFTIWKKIITTAMYKEYILKDVTVLMKCPKSHKRACFTVNKITDRQSIIEVEKLASKHLKTPHDRKMIPLLLEFLYLSGCRICEALAIDKESIKKDHLLINKELGSSISEKMVIRQCKTELSNRSIPLTDSMKEVLSAATKLSKSNYIFTDQDGNFYNSTILGDRLHKLGKKAGLDFNMYSIRHLFATDLVRNTEIDQRTRMELMGHSNIGTTLDYARSNDDLKAKALKNR